MQGQMAETSAAESGARELADRAADVERALRALDVRLAAGATLLTPMRPGGDRIAALEARFDRLEQGIQTLLARK